MNTVARTGLPALLRLKARNYKSLRSVDVELGRVNVLVGPNASGKSNLLDVIQFLGDATRTDLRPALQERGGLERMIFRGEDSGPIRLEVEAAVTRHSSDSARDVYTLNLTPASLRRSAKPQPISAILRSETIKFKRTAGRGRRITVKGRTVEIVDDEKGREPGVTRRIGLKEDSLGLATLPRLSESEGAEGIRAIAEMFSTFRVFNPDVDAARRPSPMPVDDVGFQLDSNGENLSWFLFRMAKSAPSVFESLQADASQLAPGLVRINIEEIGGAQPGVQLSLTERGLAGTTTLGEASYGTVRALCLLALLHDPNPPLLTCIEEIDHGLHPYAFDLLIERMRDASLRTQFVLATHSPALVNRLQPNELIVCEREPDGSSAIPAIPSEDVVEMELATDGDLRLGELWFSGLLRGVPR